MPDPAPALKELLGAEPHRKFAQALASVHPEFDRDRFLELTLTGMEGRSLTQRLRRATEALHDVLPGEFPAALAILRASAPKLERSFGHLVFPDYVGQYGRSHYTESMEALRFFTSFGSSEFAVREFIRLDPARSLRIMARWAEDPDEHVRRLASEGSRPRLPWSFRLEPIVKDPELTAPILARLIDDPSLYVRKSVANHLNDISKDHPDWLVQWLQSRDLSRPRTRWIAKRALRTLIKQGHPQALALVGATGAAAIDRIRFSVTPKALRLGGRITLGLSFRAQGRKSQHLVVDYAIHYVKGSGASGRKVFKWKAVDLAPDGALTLEKSQRIQDFSTRKHHAGKHVVEALVNGASVATASFVLKL